MHSSRAGEDSARAATIVRQGRARCRMRVMALVGAMGLFGTMTLVTVA